MKRILTRIFPIAIFVLNSGVFAGVGERNANNDRKVPPSKPVNEVPRDNIQPLISFIPPKPDRGMPTRNTDEGVSRSANQNIPLRLTILAPPHVARAATAQPSFYWRLSDNTDRPVTVTLIEEDGENILIEDQLSAPIKKGIYVIRVVDYDKELEPGKSYRLSVSLPYSAEYMPPSSADILVQTVIKKVSLDGEGIKDGQPQDGLDKAKFYASQGIWFEALDALMGKDPNDAVSKEILDARLQLLRQVNLEF